MSVTLTSPHPSVMKNGTKSLSFSIILRDHAGNIRDLGTNFRLMDGRINGPVSYSKQTKRYHQTRWLSRTEAMSAYDAIQEKDWVSIYDLPPMLAKDAAIQPVLLTMEVLHIMASDLFPANTQEAGEAV